MGARRVLVRVARELIPAPTLGRLVYLKRAVTGPRAQFIGDCARLSQRMLSPTMHMRVRRLALKVLGRDASAPPAAMPVPVPGQVPGQIPTLPVSEAEEQVEGQAGAQTDVQLEPKSEGQPEVQPEPKPKPLRGRAALRGPYYYQGRAFGTLDELHAAHGKIKVDISVISAFLGRYEVLDLMASEATSVPEGYRALVCLVGSSAEDEAFLKEITARNPAVLGMITENKPVGRKWQAAVDLARAVSDFGLLAITGSDDILPVGTICAMVDRHRLCTSHSSLQPYATALYGTMEWLILSEADKDALSPQLVKCSYKLDSALMPLGAGRFYARQIIDHFDGDIFETGQNRLLDDKGFYKVHRGGFGVEYFNSQQGAVLSVKGNWGQMNSFEAIVEAPTVLTREFSFEGYAILRSQLTPTTFEKLFGEKQMGENLQRSQG